MKAAVITSFDHPPRYADIVAPVAPPGQVLVDVLAVGLHQLTRGCASGRHYSGRPTLPMIAGVDGVGREADGTLRYFVQGPGLMGTMAERTLIDRARSIALPAEVDPALIAAAMNPAMAAWLALRCRVPFKRGQKVLIVGATGSSGTMAVQIARHLGASEVIAVGRDESKLAALRALGASDVATFGDGRLGALAADVDVVLDFVWGEPAVRVMETLLRKRADRSVPLSWIHVGSMAGDEAAIPGMFLRSAQLQIVGSGHGSVLDRAILAELPALVSEIARGTFYIDVRPVPLSEVEAVWNDSGARVVFTL